MPNFTPLIDKKIIGKLQDQLNRLNFSRGDMDEEQKVWLDTLLMATPRDGMTSRAVLSSINNIWSESSLVDARHRIALLLQFIGRASTLSSSRFGEEYNHDVVKLIKNVEQHLPIVLEQMGIPLVAHKEQPGIATIIKDQVTADQIADVAQQVSSQQESSNSFDC
ncbi:hypothetical protein [Piscirickettsia salmonis]|uniref:hypothetical protein n=1 Tax=Piscirickettsia salmonis TaxID=1238 RepID=UPI0007C8FC63|nr:hypothetical protein A0O36_00591 [Piscirickettsiaceae bacterium NZ-RLO1]